MASRKRTEITVQTDELLIIRRGDSSVRAWCMDCSAEVRMIPASEAVALAGIDMAGILKMVASGDVHWVQGGTCAPLICLKSLVAKLTARSPEPQ